MTASGFCICRAYSDRFGCSVHSGAVYRMTDVSCWRSAGFPLSTPALAVDQSCCAARLRDDDADLTAPPIRSCLTDPQGLDLSPPKLLSPTDLIVKARSWRWPVRLQHFGQLWQRWHAVPPVRIVIVASLQSIEQVAREELLD